MSVISVPEPKILTLGDCERFSLYYPGKLKISSLAEINTEARDLFENYSKRFILPEEYVPGDFHQIFIVKKDSGEETHLAHQTKVHQEGYERLVYLQDFCLGPLGLAGPVGHGEIRFYPEKEKEFFKDKPFVGFTETIKCLRKNGRGTDRLRLMNGLCRVLFDLPLHSGTFVAEEKVAGSPWRVLINEGKAISYQFDRDRERYRFL